MVARRLHRARSYGAECDVLGTAFGGADVVVGIDFRLAIVARRCPRAAVATWAGRAPSATERRTAGARAHARLLYGDDGRGAAVQFDVILGYCLVYHRN